MDCLVIGAAEFDRDEERTLFRRVHEGRSQDGWGRFLALNYVEYESDALMSNQLASLALRSHDGAIEKQDGHFRYRDLSDLSQWRTPLLGGMFVYQFLKSRGFSVGLVQHMQLQAETLDALLARAPRVVAISTTLITSPLQMKACVAYCRERAPEATIVLGGMSAWNEFQVRKADLPPDAGPDGESTLLEGLGFLGADAVIVDSYGIETLASLVGRVRDELPLDGLANTVCYDRGKATCTLRREPESFDAERMQMDWDRVEAEHFGNIVNVRTQISCPFRCSFCSYPTTQGPVIKAEIEAFALELDALQARGVRTLMIVDDTFNVPPKRFEAILEVLARHDFDWYSFIRCQFLTEAQVDAMKRSGCKGVYLGLESVNDETLQRMNKMSDRQSFLRGIELLRSRDITTYASFIVGFPGDTPEVVLEVRDFIEQSGLDYYNLKPFWFDHSTPIAKRAAEFGLTGQGYRWKHDRMDVGQAYDLIRDLILETRGRYVGLHSGELWEIGQLGARGFSKPQMNAVYDAHNAMLRLDLAGKRDPAAKQRAFHGLADALRGLTLAPSAW